MQAVLMTGGGGHAGSYTGAALAGPSSRPVLDNPPMAPANPCFWGYGADADDARRSRRSGNEQREKFTARQPRTMSDRAAL
jgi:hypothetical protein